MCSNICVPGPAAGRGGRDLESRVRLKLMFRKLKEALDSALSALESRSGGGAGGDLHKLLAAMREELIESKARLPELEQQIRSLQGARARELESAEDCHRRAQQALAIDDQETVEVALQFEARHRTRVEVCDQKIEAAEAELALQRQTVSDMTAQLKAAMARSESLEIQARRAGATESLRGSGHSSVDEFDRMAEAIGREDDLGAARREVDLELDEKGEADGAYGEPEGPIDPEELAELQLRELKRRMARDPGGKED